MAGKIRKVIGVLLVLTALLVSQMPGYETNAAGTNTNEFQMDGNTLVKYLGTASSVSVPAGVKKIGEEAFRGSTAISSVSIGKDVKIIGYGAFENCSSLSRISMSDSVESIGTAAFSGDSALTAFTIGSGLKVLDSAAFAGCTSLKTVSIPNNSRFIFDQSALYDKDKTRLYFYAGGATGNTYTMPDTVTRADEYGFWGNKALTSVNLSSNLAQISGYMFSNCIGLEGLTIPYSVKSIDAKAFENCTNLQYVSIPPSVTFIHDTAFDGCPYLVIQAEPGSYAYKYYETWKQSHTVSEKPAVQEETGNTVHVVGSNGQVLDVPSAGINTNVGQALHDPSNVDYIPTSDPIAEKEEGVYGKSIVVGRNAVIMMTDKLPVVGSTSTVIEPDMQTDHSSNTTIVSSNPSREYGEKGGNLPKLTVLNGKISALAYYGQQELGVYNFNEPIKEIGDFAFARSGLQSISIPNGVEKIDYAAFYHCDNLVEVDIPSSVKVIEGNAFAYTPWYRNWLNEEGTSEYLIVGKGVLIGYKGNHEVVQIPENVSYIAPGCFRDRLEILEVVLPADIEIIGEEAFMNCANLERISFPNSLEQIQDRAFMNTKLSNVVIPASVEDMGIGAFYTPDGPAEKQITFEGNKLPYITSTDSTARMENEYLRVPCMDQAWKVESTQQILTNSVLDKTMLGFGMPTTNGEERIVVESDATNLSASDITAECNGAYGYHLKVSDGNPVAMQEAYRRIYGDTVPPMQVLSILLYDPTETVSIKKFGNAPLTITIPLDSSIKGNKLHVICTDEDGQLEEVACNLLTGDSNRVQFSTSHLSTFAIYAYGEETEGTIIQNGDVNYTAVSGRKDYSPNTGDNSIHPKWFICIGLLAVALGLFVYRGPKRKMV